MNGWRGGAFKAATAVTIVISLGACSGGDKSAGPGRTLQQQRQTGAAVSPEAYRATLLAATAPIDTALTQLTKARSFKELAARVADLENAAGQAAPTPERQGGGPPPPPPPPRAP